MSIRFTADVEPFELTLFSACGMQNLHAYATHTHTQTYPTQCSTHSVSHDKACVYIFGWPWLLRFLFFVCCCFFFVASMSPNHPSILSMPLVLTLHVSCNHFTCLIYSTSRARLYINRIAFACARSRIVRYVLLTFLFYCLSFGIQPQFSIIFFFFK